MFNMFQMPNAQAHLQTSAWQFLTLSCPPTHCSIKHYLSLILCCFSVKSWLMFYLSATFLHKPLYHVIPTILLISVIIARNHASRALLGREFTGFSSTGWRSLAPDPETLIPWFQGIVQTRQRSDLNYVVKTLQNGVRINKGLSSSKESCFISCHLTTTLHHWSYSGEHLQHSQCHWKMFPQVGRTKLDTIPQV